MCKERAGTTAHCARFMPAHRANTRFMTAHCANTHLAKHASHDAIGSYESASKEHTNTLLQCWQAAHQRGSRIHTVAATDGADEASDQESAWDGGCCPAHSTNDGGHVSDVSRFRRVVYADDGDVGTALISIASEPRLDRQLCIDRVENPHLSRQGLHCHPSKQHATRTTWSWRQHGTR